MNLLNGQDTVKTLLQIVFAVAAGFSLVALFYNEMFIGIGISVILLVIYSIYLMRSYLTNEGVDISET